MKSHAILRTNVGLTSNVKLMVGATYSLYLDSIESDPALAATRYKKLQFTKDNFWDELLPHFYKNTPINTAFMVKFDNDNDKMATDFSKQYDDLYCYGARNIVNNKDYDEEYEYFAPLYIKKSKLPKKFVIFRIDGPGLNVHDKSNFYSEIVNNLKCIKMFDLTRATELGEWIETNITKNKNYPSNSFYMDFRPNEFSSWFGVDYEDGGYSEKAFMLDAMLQYENTYHDFEKMIYDGFKNNKVIYPHIINFSFLFNDNPATPTSLRRWSLNRYMGFYLDDLTLKTWVSPYELPNIKSDAIIDNYNVLSSPSGDAFVDTFKKNEFPYIEVNGEFYKIERYTTTENQVIRVETSPGTFQDILSPVSTTKYKIIANVSLAGLQSTINKNLILIDSSTGKNRLSYYNGNTFVIDGFENADVWLIQIGDMFHNIVKNQDGEYYIQSDYAFSQSLEKFDYYINDPDPNYRTSIDLKITSDNVITKFGIYSCKFSDIKDFDTDIIETKFAKHEYEKKAELTLTDEPKFHTINHQSLTHPKDLNDYKISGVVTNIPAASEYTANAETFRLVDNKLSTIWRKNSERLKWGFKGSVSANDYPYLLNNSFSAEDHNRTTNVFAMHPHRPDRNLDYFMSVNSSSKDYLHHSLHVQKHLPTGEIDTSFNFELDKYLGVNYDLDYFDYFFSMKSYFDGGNITANTAKYSYFNTGDNVTPNLTLYRGMKFKISDVDTVKITSGQIENINLKNSNNWEDYRFGVLISNNNWVVNSTIDNLNIGTISYTQNILQWNIIDNWKHDQIYTSGSVVYWNEILWISTTQSQIIDPNYDPSNSSDWQLFTYYSLSTYPTIFWSPAFDGTNPTSSNNMYGQFSGNLPPLVWNSGEYYYSTGASGSNFWNPNLSYDMGDVVLYNNATWISNTSSNTITPGNQLFTLTTPYVDSNGVTISYQPYWSSTSTSSTIWNVVELWKQDFLYTPTDTNWSSSFDSGHYVVYNDVVYATSVTASAGVIPPNDSSWTKIYSMVADTTYNYGTTFSRNNIIHFNNRYYWCNNLLPYTTNVNQTLDNGIVVYFNKKWQNVLVNIYVNDNTYTKLSNTDRDDLYTDIHSKLSAANFMTAINDLSNKYDFSDYIKYVIINEDDSLNIYDFSNIETIQNLPVLLTCEGPDEFYSRVQSITIAPVTLDSSQIKPKRKLDDGNINSLDQLNYFNDIHLATTIERRTDDTKIIPNYSGLKNEVFNIMNRHSGPYDPIFHTIELFRTHTATYSYDNYQFDVDLTYFGTIKERIVSKVNRSKNILKLKNNPNLTSVYPMLDEYGYHATDFYIFKPTWDFEYHIECIDVPQLAPVVANQSLVFPVVNNNSNNNNLNLL